MYQIDEIDRRIVRELQRDASLSHAALAERVGASAASVWRRVRNLEKEDVLGATVRLANAELLGPQRQRAVPGADDAPDDRGARRVRAVHPVARRDRRMLCHVGRMGLSAAHRGHATSPTMTASSCAACSPIPASPMPQATSRSAGEVHDRNTGLISYRSRWGGDQPKGVRKVSTAPSPIGDGSTPSRRLPATGRNDLRLKISLAIRIIFAISINRRFRRRLRAAGRAQGDDRRNQVPPGY